MTSKNDESSSFVFKDKRSSALSEEEIKKENKPKSKVSEKEKEKFEETENTAAVPEINFSMHVITLYQQTCFYLGIKMPHPDAPEPQVNLAVANINIETLDMLKEKTTNNLIPEEEKLINEVIYDLKMKYVAKAKEISPA